MVGAPAPQSPGESEQIAAPGSMAQGHAITVIIACGSLGLLIATITDAFAVAGRHLGMPLMGSIEIVQAAIVVLACASMLLATASHAHAAIHIITERVSPSGRRRLALLGAAVSVCAALLLAGGSLMMLADTWAGHERSETLYIPFVILRLLVVSALIGVALLFLRDLVRPRDGG